jgi:predicted nucleic-acid-binding protein
LAGTILQAAIKTAVIGIDTNVLLRWLIAPEDGNIGSSAAEIDIVAKTLAVTGQEFFVNTIVVAETTWILEQKLKLPRADICAVVDRLLYSLNITVADPDAVNEARQVYETSNIGFADCLIARINGRAGCTYTLTFDKKAGRQVGFRSLWTTD